MATITKKQLIELVATETEDTKANVSTTLEAIMSQLTKALANKDEITVSGFGKFYTREVSGTIPNTTKKYKSTVPAFKAGSQLKAAVKG